MKSQKNLRWKKYLSLILTLLMLVTAFPLNVRAENANNSEVETIRALDNIVATKPNDKIADDVKSAMQSEEQVEIIVYMKDKLDSLVFAEQASAKYSSKMNSYKANLQVRRDLLIALKDQAHESQYDLRQLVAKAGNKVSDFHSYFIANVAYMKASPEIIEKISALDSVEKIRKNQSYYLDDYTVEEITPLADENLWSLEMVHAPETWGVGVNGTGAVVGLVDSGTDYSHPALKNQWRGLQEDGTEDATYSWYDAVANEPLPIDSDTHGTHVCGTMVGKDEANNIITGVAPGAKWISARVFDLSGRTTDDKLLSAAEWMLAPGGNPDMAPDAVNNSWGGGATIDDWYKDAVNSYIAAGIVPVFASGNQMPGEPTPQPGSICNPSNYEESLAVGAIDQNKKRASFSKRGPSPYTDNWKPDMSAPGVSISSTLPGGRYGSMSGTSMAAPHITAVAALMRSANNGLTVSQIKNILYNNAEPLTDSDPNAQTSPNHDYGYGLVNALQSVVPVTGGIGTFKGKVLCEGEDSGPAVISHEQAVDSVYLGTDLKIEAQIHDDVSVLDAYIMVRAKDQDWARVDLRQIDGDAKGGTYVGTVKAENMGSGSEFEYKIVAEDYAANVSETEIYTIGITFGVIPGEYHEGFEGSAEGWTMDSLWQIGTPTANGEPEVFEGEQCIATAIGEYYGVEENSFLISAPIDMRDTNEASVRFMHWYSMTSYDDDIGTVYITNDYGETLNEVDRFTLQSRGWEGKVIDLKPYANSENPVYVIFHFTSNDWGQDFGWYIDDFRVEGVDTTPPEAPTNLEADAKLTAVQLTWDFQQVADFKEFEIYRSTTANDLGELIKRTTYNNYQDLYINLEDDTNYYYTVKASDIFGNVSDASNKATATKRENNVVELWDFEDDNGNFTTGEVSGIYNDWEWGQVGENHGPKSALTGNNVWATGLDSDYSFATEAYLKTPEITIPAEGYTYLTMNHWYHFERMTEDGMKWDYGQVHIKREGSDNWINITPPDEGEYAGEGKYGGPVSEADSRWLLEEIDISDYAGQTVEIRFYYTTDWSGQCAGWFINDVNIVNVPDTSSFNIGTEFITSVTNTNRLADFSLDFSTVGHDCSELTNKELGKMNIPVTDATVSVVESGQVVSSDNRTGDYTMLHKASEEGEEWTLVAEAYGYVPQYFESALADDEVVEHTFILDKQATGTINGQVYDRYNHDPVPNAIVQVVEDPNVDSVLTDENGNFTIDNVYIGEYTLHASAEHFESGSSTVTVVADETAECDIPLKRFIGLPGDIIYDDGEVENATVLIRPGGGIAMRFTPEKYGKLKSASFYFWDETWPEPGGNEIGFAVFVKDGSNYKQIGETIVKDDIVRGAWNTIDLSSLNFETDEDFYVTSIQTQAGDHSPGQGLFSDPNSEISQRSYFFADGSFIDFPSEDYAEYGAMIRAHMAYAAEAPLITNLEDVHYTNQDNILVEGIVDYSEGEVLLYADDVLKKTITSEEIDDYSFSADIELLQEETNITATLKVGERETEPSEGKVVIKDQNAPELIVSEPYDGEHLNVELVHVKGTVTDKYFDKLTINGVEIEPAADGSFDYKMIVEEGENQIELLAVDKAGNETSEEMTIYVAFDAANITEMKPAQDVIVKPGESLEFSFRSSENGQARYTLLSATGTDAIELNSTAMTEVEPGYYKATWTAANTVADKAKVYFEFTNAYGEYVDAIAPGRVSIIKGNLLDRLYGSNRYKTATKLSQLMYEEAETVILASGENFPDALVGGSYAEELDVPILLTRQADLPEETLAELGRLGTTKVIILGGPLAISSEVESTLEEAGLEVERIAGSNRYKTAVEIARLARAEESTHVFIASGEKFEDALSIVPAVALSDDALLLTSKAGLHEATLAALEEFGTESITLMGGELVIPKVIEEELKDLGYAVDRIAGSNRYKTNIQIAEQYFPAATKVIGASGENFPDALVATVYAAKEGRPIILLDPDGLRDVTVEYFEDKPIEHVLLMGGPLAIPEAIEYQLIGILADK